MSVRRSPFVEVDRLWPEKAAMRTRHVASLYFHISQGNLPGNKTSLTKTRWSAKNIMAFTLTGRSQVGSHCPEGNWQIQTGFVDCGRPPGPDVAFLSRSPQHLRYFAAPSLCRKRSKNEPLVTPEDNRFSFLTHVRAMLEWWMILSPEECCWLWYMDLFKKSVCLVPCLRFRVSGTSALAFDTTNACVTETLQTHTQDSEASLCSSSLKTHRYALHVFCAEKSRPNKLISVATWSCIH